MSFGWFWNKSWYLADLFGIGRKWLWLHIWQAVEIIVQAIHKTKQCLLALMSSPTEQAHANLHQVKITALNITTVHKSSLETGRVQITDRDWQGMWGGGLLHSCIERSRKRTLQECPTCCASVFSSSSWGTAKWVGPSVLGMWPCVVGQSVAEKGVGHFKECVFIVQIKQIWSKVVRVGQDFIGECAEPSKSEMYVLQ